MNKILLVNKDKDMTSRDVVNKLCKIFKTKKIGHTGTLDPIATGVLVIVMNEATKLCELLTSSYKEYIAEIKLGIKTDTKDITGEIIEKKDIKSIDKEVIIETLNSFLGDSYQEVPIYSAVKINGKKLYEYARNNEKVDLPKRKINVKNIQLLDYNDDIIKFKVVVSKGTYIRSLVEDIAKKLGTVGTMLSLQRTRQGDFKIEDSFTLSDIEKGNYKFLSLKDVLKDYKQIELNEKDYFKVKNGAILDKILEEDIIVYLYQQEVVGIYKTYEKNTTKIKPYKIFNN